MKRRIGMMIFLAGVLAASGAWAEDPVVGAPAKIEVPAAAIATPEAAPAATEEAPAAAAWKPNAVGQFTVNQNAFSNWKAGGVDSLAWQANLNLGADYASPDWLWVNTGKFAYGATRSEGQDFRKSADEIRIESVLTWNLPFVVKPYAALRGETQFTTGYEYHGVTVTPTPKSGFLDPGYFTESVGVGYAVDKFLKTRIGFAVKETVTRTYSDASNDKTTPDIERLKVEPGAEWVTDCKRPLSDILVSTWQLNVFSNCKAPDEIVVRWDWLLSANVAKYVTVNLNLILFYDKAVSTQRQLSETLAVGLTYSFI